MLVKIIRFPDLNIHHSVHIIPAHFKILFQKSCPNKSIFVSRLIDSISPGLGFLLQSTFMD